MNNIGEVEGDFLPPTMTPDDLLKQGQQPEPTTRPVTLAVPRQMTDEMVQTIWSLGVSAFQAAQQSAMFMAFPQQSTTDDGHPVMQLVGQMVLLAGPQDAERMVKVGEAITAVNLQAQKAKASGAADQLTAQVRGKKVKDNAVREAIGQTKGSGGIIVAG